MMSLWPDLSSRILYRPDPPVLFRRLDLYGGILHNLHRGNWRGLYGHGLCLGIFIGRPGFEFLQQAFGWRLNDLGSILIGRFGSCSNFVARRRVACRRRQIQSSGE